MSHEQAQFSPPRLSPHKRPKGIDWRQILEVDKEHLRFPVRVIAKRHNCTTQTVYVQLRRRNLMAPAKTESADRT